MLAATLGGCLLQLPPPEIELDIEPAYNDQEVLIPYRLTGDAREAHGRWSLSILTEAEFELIETREIRIPSGASGVLQFDGLPEADFELTFELLSSRSGGYDVVPYLTRRHRFLVDRTPPPALIVEPDAGWNVDFYEGPALLAGDGSMRGWGGPLVWNVPTPPGESPVRLLVVVNEPRPPVEGEDEYDGSEIEFWYAGIGGGFTATITIVAVDEAGNRSQPYVRSYTTI